MSTCNTKKTRAKKYVLEMELKEAKREKYRICYLKIFLGCPETDERHWKKADQKKYMKVVCGFLQNTAAHATPRRELNSARLTGATRGEHTGIILCVEDLEKCLH